MLARCGCFQNEVKALHSSENGDDNDSDRIARDYVAVGVKMRQNARNWNILKIHKVCKMNNTYLIEQYTITSNL